MIYRKGRRRPFFLSLTSTQIHIPTSDLKSEQSELVRHKKTKTKNNVEKSDHGITAVLCR